MKTRLAMPPNAAPAQFSFPNTDALAALRAWYAGVSARDAGPLAASSAESVGS